MNPKNRWLPAFVLVAALIPLSLFALATDDETKSAASAHVLAAELALQHTEYAKSAREYRLAAEASESVEIARNATQLAFTYQFNEDALISAKRWMKLEGDSSKALLYVAQLQLRLGKERDARKSFTKLIERGDGAPEEQLPLLTPILGEEDSEAGFRLMRELAKPYPDSALAHYSVAIMALSADDAEYAQRRVLKAIEIKPEWTKARLLYARSLLIQGRQEEAIDYTARIIGDDPDPDPDARMELALMMMSAGRDDDALSQVNQVLLEQSGRPDALRLMAIINFRQEHLDAAWEDFQDLLTTGQYKMDALYYLARISDYREQYDRAVRLYSGVVNGDHAMPAQRRATALVAFQQHDPELALERLDKFASEYPTHAIAVVLAKAQLFASLERYDDALVQYDRFVLYRPNSEGGSLGRAELLLRMDRLDESLEQYRITVKRWPDSALSLNALGYTLADRTDQYREAHKLIKKAIKFEPDNPAIIDSMGWVLFKLGENEEALVQLERAYAEFPDPEVAAHIVEVLDALDRRDEALRFLQAAEEKDPASSLLNDVRERVFPETP